MFAKRRSPALARVAVASLTSFRCPGTRRDGLVHLRSMPAPVAVGGRDYTSAPPAAPSTGTDRFLKIVTTLPPHEWHMEAR